MRKSLVAFSPSTLFAMLAACGANAAPHAIGTYHVDKEALQHVSTTGMSVEQAAAVVSTIESTMELKADGTSSLHLKVPPMQVDDTVRGTWRLDGDQLSLTAKGSDGKDKTEVVTYANGSFTLPTEGKVKMALTFRKK
jgi:hypothetical protein